MKTMTHPGLIRRMTSPERVLLMMPLNVVMAARIKGPVDVDRLTSVLNSLRKRHALLGVRVVMDEDDTAWYTADGVPDFAVNVISRQTDDQWLQTAKQECKTSFAIETGPLVRFSLLHAPETSDLIVCGHHAICDGTSLAYLIRDALKLLSDAGQEVEILPEPPAITKDSVPSPPSVKPMAKLVMGLINKKWRREGISFDSTDLTKLHRVFWERNPNMGLLSWEWSIPETQALVARCREEGITVNSALWAAFQAAQYAVQGGEEPYRASAGMAVSVRDKMSVPVGEAFGFYASSLTAQLAHDPSRSFWDSARIMHKRIADSLSKTNVFRSLAVESLAPTLLDSLYFSKYGLIKSRLSDRLVRQMNWHGTSYGYSITNVGRMNIPTSYGPYELEAVYGPLVYSDVNEKTMGVITVGGKATFLMSYNEGNVSEPTARAIRDRAMDTLSAAVKSPTRR